MMPSTTATSVLAVTLMIVLLLPSSQAVEYSDTKGCETGHYGACHNRPEALRLKVIAIAAILLASALGICLPLFTRSIPALSPEGNLFAIVKAFASGVILATGYMHVLPDSFDMLTSPCLPKNPWGKFPFTTFVAMISAIFTLMVDSFMMTFYNRKASSRRRASAEVVSHDCDMDASPARATEMLPVVSHNHHGHCHEAPGQLSKDVDQEESALRRYRIIAQVLELGIVVHSVVIGLSLGASQSPCTIRPLVAALCFHQLFEGMGLGGCILQAEYGMKMKSIMVFFFATTTPFGIALGIALSNVYSENSSIALIVVGILNGSSAGLLNYMALVDLLSADFLGPRLQSSWRLQGLAYVAVLAGAGGMSLMAKWA